MEYIREQVEMFNFGVSQNMTKNKHFHNVNTSHKKSYKAKQHKDDSLVIFPNEVKLSVFLLGVNTINTESIKRKIK